jgi:hypothetical protein
MAFQGIDIYKLPTQPGELYPPREPPTAEEQAIINTLKDCIENSSSSLLSITNSLEDPIDAAFSNAASQPEASPDAGTLLWRLYNSIIRLSRTISSENETGQQRLIDVIRALKARPEPPKPIGAPGLLDQWEYDSLWKELVAFGAACREELNESPGQRYWLVEP